MQNIAIFPNEERDIGLCATQEVAAALNGYGKTVIFDEQYKGRISG